MSDSHPAGAKTDCDPDESHIDSKLMIQVICWVLGEYGTISGTSAASVMDQICAVQDRQTIDDGLRGYMLSALAKLSTHGGTSLTAAAEELLNSAIHSRNVNLQQRALEVDALLRWDSFAQVT